MPHRWSGLFVCADWLVWKWLASSTLLRAGEETKWRVESLISTTFWCVNRKKERLFFSVLVWHVSKQLFTSVSVINFQFNALGILKEKKSHRSHVYQVLSGDRWCIVGFDANVKFAMLYHFFNFSCNVLLKQLKFWKMYNNIGLQTARGSGTNGYVQRNLSLLRSRKDKIEYHTNDDLAKLEQMNTKKPNQEILEHERKRQIELKCIELQEVMEEQGWVLRPSGILLFNTVVFLLTAKLKTVPDSLILSCLLLLPGRVSVVFYQVTEWSGLSIYCPWYHSDEVCNTTRVVNIFGN